MRMRSYTFSLSEAIADLLDNKLKFLSQGLFCAIVCLIYEMPFATSVAAFGRAADVARVAVGETGYL
jgi:hypothetical protein